MTEHIHISEVQNSDQKSFYTEEILEALPDWFGNKQALDEYAEQVKGFPYYGAFNHADKCIGFFSVKTHYQHTGEIFVCGVLPEYQHGGVGKALYRAVENYFVQSLYACFGKLKSVSLSSERQPFVLSWIFSQLDSRTL